MRHWPLRITLLCTGVVMIWASHRINEADKLALPHTSMTAICLFLGGVALICGTLYWCVLSYPDAEQTRPIRRGFEVVCHSDNDKGATADTPQPRDK